MGVAHVYLLEWGELKSDVPNTLDFRQSCCSLNLCTVIPSLALSLCGNQAWGQQVERRGFACAVGADECVDVAILYTQIDAMGRNKTLNALMSLWVSKMISAAIDFLPGQQRMTSSWIL